jgi:glycosyltransferase involved in cell wall biosynthesis
MKIIFLNQVSGLLFSQLVEDIASNVYLECILNTGYMEEETMIKSAKIRHAPTYITSSLLSRLISWFQYTIDAFFYCWITTSNDILFIVSNPPFNGIIGWLLKKLNGSRYIILLYDLHPDTAVAFGKLSESNPITKIWRWINRNVWENASAVITLGPCMAERVEKQFDASKTSSGKVLIVPPWADTEYIRPIPKLENPFLQQLTLSDKTIILYSGNFGISHDIESILSACKQLTAREDIHFLLIGQGKKWQNAVDYQQRERLPNLTVLPYQPKSVYPYSVASGDIALVSLELAAESLMLPSKTYSSMAAGSCIVGICGKYNDLRETIERHKCGRFVEPGHPQELVENLLQIIDCPQLLEQFKKNSREAAETFYSRQSQKLSFVKILKQVNLID